MYMDENIVLREDLPKQLRKDFAELAKYYADGDWFHFDLLLESVEATVKAHYLAGNISRQDLDLIFRKYGIA